MEIKRKLSEGVKKEKGVTLCKGNRKVSKGKKQIVRTVKNRQEFWEKREEPRGKS